MANQQFVIDLGEGQRGIVKPDDEAWLLAKLREERGAARLEVRYDEDETEGHRLGASPAVRLIATDDTEGHALSIHFPSRADADAFRRRLLVTGVLAGTVALGAAGGIGLANLANDDPAAGGAVSGAATTGMDWTQAERQDAAALGGAATTGMDWTQAERPGQAAAAADEVNEPSVTRPQPR